MFNSVHDVISPEAFNCFLFFGYLTFSLAWIVLSYAVMRGLLDFVEWCDRLSPETALKAARSRQVNSDESRWPLSANLAMPARVYFRKPARRVGLR